jgi:hypothetical protein
MRTGTPVVMPPPDVRKRLRAAAGVSTELLAVALDVSTSSLRRAEKGNQRNPRVLFRTDVYMRCLSYIASELRKSNPAAYKWALTGERVEETVNAR